MSKWSRPYNQTNEFVYLGGNVNHNADLSIEVNRLIIHNAWCTFRKYTLELYDQPRAPLELKIRMTRRAEVLSRQCYTAASRGACARATTTPCAEPTIASLLAASVGERTIVPTTRFLVWAGLSRREVRALRRLYAGGESCLHDLWRAWRVRDCRSV